jgi:hypothetical protein
MLGITRRARWIAMLPILSPSAAGAARVSLDRGDIRVVVHR